MIARDSSAVYVITELLQGYVGSWQDVEGHYTYFLFRPGFGNSGDMTYFPFSFFSSFSASLPAPAITGGGPGPAPRFGFAQRN